MNTYYRTTKMSGKRKRIPAAQYYRNLKRRRYLRRKYAARTIGRFFKKYKGRWARRTRAKLYRTPTKYYRSRHWLPSSWRCTLTLCRDIQLDLQNPIIIAFNNHAPVKLAETVGHETWQGRGFDEYERLYQKFCVVGASVHVDPMRVDSVLSTQAVESGRVDVQQIPPTFDHIVYDRVRSPFEITMVKEDLYDTGLKHPIPKMRELGKYYKRAEISNEYLAKKAQGRSMVMNFGVYKDFGLQRKDRIFEVDNTLSFADDATLLAEPANEQNELDQPNKCVWGINRSYALNGATHAPVEPKMSKYCYIEMQNTTNDPVTTGLNVQPSGQKLLCRVTIKQTIVFFNKRRVEASTVAI